MKFYLRIINPVLAVLSLVLCFWAATFSDGDFEISGLVIGGMNTCFFAATLFIGGELSDKESKAVGDLTPGAATDFVIDFGDFNNSSIEDTVTCGFAVKAR